MADEPVGDMPTPVTSIKMPDKTASSITIQLNIPYEIGGELQKEVTIRRPKVRDRLTVDRDSSLISEGEKESRLIGNLCNMLPEDLQTMDLSDYRQLQEKLQGFIFPQLMI